MRFRTSIVYSLLALAACGGEQSTPTTPASTGVIATNVANVAPAVVQEVLVGDGRVYARVAEGQWDFWFVAPEAPLKVDDHVLLGKGPLRRNLVSAALGRTFAEIVELPNFAVVDAATAASALRLSPPPGGLAIEDVYAQRTALSGQPVAVRGRVVKANKGIFGTNWYHLQDGTGDAEAGTNDLTITSDAELDVGDVAVAKGPLTIDKDLGFGYFYAAIIEDCTVTVDPG